jgi:hypothetical protein
VPVDYSYATCALFGYRPDRDRLGYYRLLLNQLAEVTDRPIVAASNDPSQLSSRIQCMEAGDLDRWARQLWDVPDRDEQVRKLVGWNSQNLAATIYTNPTLVAMYLAKTAILFELAERHGDILWLDAGLFFSHVYGHDVPSGWRGYDPELLTTRVDATVKAYQAKGEPAFATFRRKRKLFRGDRPHFHTLSYNDMTRLGEAIGAPSGRDYVTAPVIYFPAARVKEIRDEFRHTWAEMVGLGRMGTEENVFSVMKWKHNWPGLTVEEWISLMHVGRGR